MRSRREGQLQGLHWTRCEQIPTIDGSMGLVKTTSVGTIHEPCQAMFIGACCLPTIETSEGAREHNMRAHSHIPPFVQPWKERVSKKREGCVDGQCT
jgi:hypothetical protein